MDSLIQKYLDGELTDEESRVFLEALASDQDLNNEVRALEELVDIGSGLESPTPSDGFTDRVMEEVGALDTPIPLPVKKTNRPVFWRGNLLPLAASWALALGMGYFLSQGLLGNTADNVGFEVDSQSALSVASPGEVSVAGLKVVRLVYSPPPGNVSSVRVAGSFNNWDPDKTSMHLENGRWTTSLVLPPGNYEYMFVVDGNTWVTDPLALTTRDDGFGSKNAVLELGL
jgi:hypothetical protein